MSIVLPLYCAGICWTMIYDTIYAHQVLIANHVCSLTECNFNRFRVLGVYSIHCMQEMYYLKSVLLVVELGNLFIIG